MKICDTELTELTEEQIKALATSVQKAGKAMMDFAKTVGNIVETDEFKNYIKARKELCKKFNIKTT